MITLETLQHFCDRNGHEYLATPFNYDGFTYACSGVLAVRVPALPGGRVADDDKMLGIAKTCAGLFDKAPSRPGDYRPLPVFPPEKQFQPCKECDGKGMFRRCPTCLGEGETKCCECGHYRTCGFCSGKGWLPGALPDTAPDDTDQCDECHGTGQREITRHVKVGGNTFNATYLELLRDHLPGLCIDYSENKAQAPVPFTFDGGAGVILPMRFAETLDTGAVVK